MFGLKPQRRLDKALASFHKTINELHSIADACAEEAEQNNDEIQRLNTLNSALRDTQAKASKAAVRLSGLVE